MPPQNPPSPGVATLGIQLLVLRRECVRAGLEWESFRRACLYPGHAAPRDLTTAIREVCAHLIPQLRKKGNKRSSKWALKPRTAGIFALQMLDGCNTVMIRPPEELITLVAQLLQFEVHSTLDISSLLQHGLAPPPKNAIARYQALEILASDHQTPISVVAKACGVHRATISNWVKKDETFLEDLNFLKGLRL